MTLAPGAWSEVDVDLWPWFLEPGQRRSIQVVYRLDARVLFHFRQLKKAGDLAPGEWMSNTLELP